MAFTSADVAALEAQIQAAIADGTWRARAMQFEGQSVQLNSMEEAQRFLGWLRQQVAAATGSTTRYAAISKGV